MSTSNVYTRREFLRNSAVAAAAGTLAANALFPGKILAAEEIELTYYLPGRDLGFRYNSKIMETFNAKMQADGKPWRMKLLMGPATDNDYLTKLNLDAATGTLADIADIANQSLPDLVAAGYLLDLTDFVNGWDDWGKFAPALVQQVTFNGKVYGVTNGSTFTCFYRKDLLEEAGISTDQPRAWDDFYGICDDIVSKTGAIPAGIPAGKQWGGGTWSEGFRHVWLGFAKSEEIFDPAAGKWVVSSDGLLKALKVYETLVKNGWLTVDALLAPNPWEPIKYQGFPQKKVALTTGGDWQWTFDWGPDGATPIENLFEVVDRWRFPSEVSEPFVFASAHWPMSIYHKAKDPEGAFEFLKWKYSPEGSCAAYEIYLSGPSGRFDMADHCDYYRTAVNGKMAEASAWFKTGRFIVSGPGAAKIADGVAEATESILTGKKSAEQAMEFFAKEMKDALGEDAVKEL